MRHWINLCEAAMFPDYDEDINLPAEFPQQNGRYVLTPELIKLLKKVRHSCRISNGGGGSCHLVSEWLEGQYDFERVEGWYCSSDGRMICSHHLWNETPDGAIIDATADQLGEDEGIRIIYPDNPLYARYHVRWGNRRPVDSEEDYDAIYKQGDEQAEEQDREAEKSGEGWWLADKARYNKYTKTNSRYN